MAYDMTNYRVLDPACGSGKPEITVVDVPGRRSSSVRAILGRALVR